MVLLCCWLLPMGAQQMWVEDFTRLRRPVWNRSKTKVDKKLALLDLVTGEKGFEFKANGQQSAEAEEGDGVITVKLPDKTRFLTVKHPDYGQRTWLVPVKHLKRKKHYRATLQTINAEKEYQLDRQWVVFNVSPENAILRIDSTVTLLRKPSAMFFLPIGNHSYQVESPFYEAVKDSFLLTDTAKVCVNVSLQPVYSYLTVKTPWDNGEIFIDGQAIAMRESTSKRLMAGMHRLSVFIGETCCYDAFCSIGKAEKKIVTLTQDDYQPQPQTKSEMMVVNIMDETPRVTPVDSAQETPYVNPMLAMVTLKAGDDDTDILLDREKVGKGQWSGQLPQGYHIASTRKNGIESVSTDLWISDSFPMEVQLAMPQTGCGMLNITSNVSGAKVFIDSVLLGETPLVTACLPTRHNYVVRLQKAGYHEAQQTYQPKSNDLLDVYIKLKRKKNSK